MKKKTITPLYPISLLCQLLTFSFLESKIGLSGQIAVSNINWLDSQIGQGEQTRKVTPCSVWLFRTTSAFFPKQTKSVIDYKTFLHNLQDTGGLTLCFSGFLYICRKISPNAYTALSIAKAITWGRYGMLI